MNREQAESLLAQLVFDDLEEAVRSELLEYLKTDAALSERLGDMRLTAKLLHDAVEAGEAPKLDERHKVELHKRIERDKRRVGVMGVLTRPIGSRLAMYSALAAACFLIVALLLPSLGAARRSSRQMQATSQARGVGQGMYLYAEKNDGRYPERVSQLVEGGYISPDYLISPDSDVTLPGGFDKLSQQQQNEWIDRNSSFKLMAGGEKASGLDTERIIGYMEHSGGKGVSIARGDGSASFENVEDLSGLPELLGVETESPRRFFQRLNLGIDQFATGRAPTIAGQSGEDTALAAQQARIDDARRKLARKAGESGGALVGGFVIAPEESDVSGRDARLGRRGFVSDLEPLPDAGGFDSTLRVTPFGDAGNSVAGGGGGYGSGTRYREGAARYGSDVYSDAIVLNEPVDEAASAGVAIDVLSRRVAPTGARDLRVLGESVVSESGPVPAASPALAQTPPSVVNGPVFDLTESLSNVESDQMRNLFADEMREKNLGVQLQTTDEAKAQADEKSDVYRLIEESGEYPADWPQITSKRLDTDGEDTTVLGEGAIVLGAELRLEKARKESEVSESVEVVKALEDAERNNLGQDIQTARKPRLMPVNPWVMAADDRLSTFALDVDTASYGIARRYIHDGFLPPRHTVRMEEFVNSFDYNYPTGQLGSEAFTVHAEAGPSPFGRDTVLLKVGVRGKVVGRDRAKPAHLVFVIDTSGSMDRDDRLPLVRQSLAMVLDQLSDNDRVTVVGYGTEARLLIESAPGGDKQRILDAVESLQIGGSTNLLGGVAMGYEVAQRHYITGGVNRVILCSDGVANVGPSEADDLLDQAGSLRKQGVTFTSVGFGAGNYDDRILEQLANKGDGGYLFVGSFDEAKRVFVDDMAATRPTIAFDAKIQVDFDPARVRRYRLIGYENRDIADADFRNDTVDAGEVGSGQSATALYEIELIGPMLTIGDEPDLGTVFVRYRDADTGRVREIESRLTNDQIVRRTAAGDARFYLAASAARFAEVLRGSEHVTEPDIGRNLARVQSVLETVAAQFPMDRSVQELLEMVSRAQGLPRAE